MVIHTHTERKIEQTLKTTEVLTGITIAELKGKSRKVPIPFARSVVFKSLREFTDLSWSQIGEVLNRDHATAIHNCRNVFPHSQDLHLFRQLYLTIEDLYTETEKYEEFNDVETLKNRLSNAHTTINILKEQVKRIKLQTKEYEDHEKKYRELPAHKQQLFKERVNAILKMI